eukprot:COSAG05_NODE_352_length_10911_cov_31.817139_11_plen_780_part_00
MSALDTLSEIYPENTPAARRGLRGILEKNFLDANQEIIDALAPQQEALAKLKAMVENLNASVDSIGETLSARRADTEGVMAELDRMEAEKARIEKRQAELDKFREQYTLTEEQEETLKRGTIDEAFLGCLKRLKQIRTDCSQLLRTKDQRTGLELMDVTGAHQEAAFERLYRWVQSACQADGLEVDSPELGFLSVAVQALRERPVLFKYCVEEMGKSRRATVLNAFLCALTQGGPSGKPRPIELSAHDPVRYIGDMVSWLHQALASEAELLRLVLGGELEPESADKRGDEKEPVAAADAADKAVENHAEGVGGDGAATAKGEAADAEDAEATEAAEMAAATAMTLRTRVLESAFQAVCRPFKTRVEQSTAAVSMEIVSGQAGGGGGRDWLAAYELSHLLAFYAQTMAALLPPQSPTPTDAATASVPDSATATQGAKTGSPRAGDGGPGAGLPATLRECQRHCEGLIFRAWGRYNELLLQTPPLCPPDLSPSPAIDSGGADGAVQRISTACTACEASILPPEQRTAEHFAPLLRLGLDAPLRSCYLSGTAARLDESGMAIFMINNLGALETALRPHTTLCGGRLEALRAQLNANQETLVSTQVSSILTGCGLAIPYRTLVQAAGATSGGGGGGDTTAVTGEAEGCSAVELTAAFNAFYGQLFAAAGPGGASIATTITAASSSSSSSSSMIGGGHGGLAVRTEGQTRIFEACARLVQPKLRAETRSAITAGVLQCYTELYAVVHDTNGGAGAGREASSCRYDQPHKITGQYDPDSVRLLLE